ncbi:hypothetical protein QC760_002516 [Botrytis cinerea]
MHSLLFWLTAALLPFAHGAGVTGSASGAAHGVTGGGSASPVTPSTTAELISYLTDSSPRVILITKTFDFRGTLGTTTATGCVPTSNTCGSSGQNAINANGWSASSSAGGSIFTTASGTESSCTAYLGRACVANALSSSGAMAGYGTTAFLATIKTKESGYVPAAIAASSVPAYVVAHAGIGKL